MVIACLMLAGVVPLAAAAESVPSAGCRQPDLRPVCVRQVRADHGQLGRVVCADAYLGGRFTKACATHFTANSPAAAQRQAEKARAYTDAWIAADIPVVVSGDTNLLPDSAGMRALRPARGHRQVPRGGPRQRPDIRHRRIPPGRRRSSTTFSSALGTSVIPPVAWSATTNASRITTSCAAAPPGRPARRASASIREEHAPRPCTNW
ncbi:hypothetical protein ACU686_32610 [Yinghuangia aomiensis]